MVRFTGISKVGERLRISRGMMPAGPRAKTQYQRTMDTLRHNGALFCDGDPEERGPQGPSSRVGGR